MDNRRASSLLLFLLIFFLLAGPDPRPLPVPLSKEELQRRLAEEKQVSSFLNSSSYGDLDSGSSRWLPLAGLKEIDGYAWGLLPAVQTRAREQLQFIFYSSGIDIPDVSLASSNELTAASNLTRLTLPVYRNVTGKVRGSWVRWKEPKLAHRPNLTYITTNHNYFIREFGRNITAGKGQVIFDFHEDADTGRNIDANGVPVREITADMAIEGSEAFGEDWIIPMSGVHFPETGAIVVSTTSEKFDGFPALSHFTLSKDSFETSRLLVAKSISETLLLEERQPGLYSPWYSSPYQEETMMFASPKCEYLAYIQQHPVIIGNELAKESTIHAIENELRYPRGAPIPPPPPMVMSTTIFSPDCGIVLESKGSPTYTPQDGLYLSGLKREEHLKYSKKVMFIIAGILLLQTRLLIKQVQDASTPSTQSRISFYTIAMMSMGDTMLLSLAIVSLWSEASFLLIAGTCFIAFFSACYLAMGFQIDIWSTQISERQGNNTNRSSPQPPVTQSSSTFPVPASAPTPNDTGATAVIRPIIEPVSNTVSVQNPANNEPAPTSPATVYMLFYLVYVALSFFTSWATLLPARFLKAYLDTLSFIYLSFWVPQIYRNVMRNCRKSLRWDFVVGQSLLRLFPFVYLYLFPRNALAVSLSFIEVAVFACWIWIQNWVLVGQDVLGPRFFVPKHWVPPAYNYHPLLRDPSATGSDDDLESGNALLITSLRMEQRDAPQSSNDGNTGIGNRKSKIFDCAICMQDIQVPVLMSESVSGSSGSRMAETATNIFSRRAYMVTPCSHIFHTQCLETWMRLRLQCPICRESIPPI